MVSRKRFSKVAVITRTKDRGVLLDRAIRSVHSQNMNDFVHVIINDAGDSEIVDSLLTKHKDLVGDRVKVIHNKESKGMEAASNKAIASVDSTYIVIHDDDDSWHPDFLKKATEHLDKSGSAGVVLVTDSVVERIHGDRIVKLSQERWLPGTTEVNLYKQCMVNYATTISFVYKRTAYEEIGHYDETLPVSSDWDFALRFLLKHDIDFVNSDEALAYYHHRPDQKGPSGNSVFAGADLHKHYINKLSNKYLRDDIQKGKFGLGYIVNEIRYRHEREGVLHSSLNERFGAIDRSIINLTNILIERTSIGKRFKNIVSNRRLK